jgi:hypothetical protein
MEPNPQPEGWDVTVSKTKKNLTNKSRNFWHKD